MTTTNMAQATPQPQSQPVSRAWTRERTLVALAFVALMVAAAGARLLTFERYLPFMDRRIETNAFLLTLHARGFDEEDTIYGSSVPITGEWLAGYPPAYMWVNSLTHRAVETFTAKQWLFAYDYIYAGRVLAVMVGVVTTGLMVWAGWLIGGRLAAWVAGLIWALSPIVLNENSLAVPDPLVFLTTAGLFATGLQAWRRGSQVWLLACLVFGVVGVYLKYTPVFALVVWGVVALDLLRGAPRKTLPGLVAQGVFAVVSAVYLTVSVGAFGLSNGDSDKFFNDGVSNALNLTWNLDNAYYELLPTGVILTALVLLAGLAAYLYSRRRGDKALDMRFVGLIALYVVAGHVFTTAYSHITERLLRYSLPTSQGVMLLVGAAVAQVAWTLDARVKRLPGWVVPGVVTLAVSVPLLLGTSNLLRTLNLTDTRYVLWRYSDSSVPADAGMILMKEASTLNEVWNRAYSGYDGETFVWAINDRPWELPPEQHVREGDVMYFVMSRTDEKNFLDEDALDAWVDELLLLKTIENGDGMLGDEIYFYRMLPPQVESDARFGGQITLEGYDLSAETVPPGETLTFRPYWQAEEQPQGNYSMFVHLYPAGTTDVVAQFDGAPASPERLTPSWTDEDEVIMGAAVSLTVPEDVPPGDYTLAVGLYDFTSGVRLVLEDGADAVLIPVVVE